MSRGQHGSRFLGVNRVTYLIHYISPETVVNYK